MESNAETSQSHRSSSRRVILLSAAIIAVVIILDQWLKFWVKTSFYLGEDLEICSWFHLLFVQNPGMAFGWSMGSKLALTLFRIVAIAAGVWYLARLSRRSGVPTGFVVCISLIVAGAIGNVIDCMFYGMVFDNPMPPHLATFLPANGGYAPFLHGQVVDMLYFPLFSFTWPAWIPGIGGDEFVFFHPIFNLADAAISVGVIALILFYSKYLSLKPSADADEAAAEA
jgi:signal peptidase II